MMVCWFTYVKTFFIPDQKSKSNPKPEPEPEPEKPKKRKWFLKRFKFKRCSSPEAPRRMVDEAAVEQRNRAMAVAIATASAADAAVAAANAAAEVVRLTTVVAPHRVQWKFDLLRSAAITIQTSYRAHLARKALCALKGIVKLQAVIRGEVTRRNVVARLSSMLDYLHRCDSRREERKLPNNSHRRDFSLVSKEDSYLRRREAIAKKERMRRYSSYTRDRCFLFHEPRRYDKSLIESAVVLRENRKKNWFDARKESEAEAIHSDNTTPVSMTKLMQLKLKAAEKCEEANEQRSTFSVPRRSHFQARKKSVGENESLPNSPIFPAYMAATKSAQAKCRSVSMPKQHLRLPDDDTIWHAPYYTQCILSPESEMSKINRRNSISSLSERTIDPLIFLQRKRGHP